MAPPIVLLMHFPVFRCSVYTNWLRKLPRPRTSSVHGRSSSWRTLQPLPKTRGCYINTVDIPSRNQSTPSVLCSIYYLTLPSFTTYPTLFLLLYGLPCFLQNHQGISCWYLPWTPGERLWRSNQGWITASAVHRDHKVLKLVLAYPLPSQSSKTLKSQFRLESAFSPLEKRLLWAAFTMAFYGFLRASKFVTPSLKWQHVQRTGNAYTIFNEQPKTDPFRCGYLITIYASSILTCPVKALQLYAEAVPQHQGNAPIFKGSRFSPLKWHIQYVIFCRAHHITNSTAPATVFKVVQQPLLQQACQIGSLKPLADGAAMLTICTYGHPQRC